MNCVLSIIIFVGGSAATALRRTPGTAPAPIKFSNRFAALAIDSDSDEETESASNSGIGESEDLELSCLVGTDFELEDLVTINKPEAAARSLEDHMGEIIGCEVNNKANLICVRNAGCWQAKDLIKVEFEDAESGDEDEGFVTADEYETDDEEERQSTATSSSTTSASSSTTTTTSSVTTSATSVITATSSSTHSVETSSTTTSALSTTSASASSTTSAPVTTTKTSASTRANSLMSFMTLLLLSLILHA